MSKQVMSDGFGLVESYFTYLLQVIIYFMV